MEIALAMESMRIRKTIEMNFDYGDPRKNQNIQQGIGGYRVVYL